MLAVGARQGSFPGMLDQRTFRIVFVGPNHGRGAAETATAEQVVTYSGAALSIRAP
jgi:alpha-D-xyloside xylohydrolase